MCTPSKPYDVEIKPEWKSAIREAIRESKKVPINRKYDIPYLAGPNKSGTLVYIDRHVPKSYMENSRMVRVDRYLTSHECVERKLMEDFDLPYLKAHKIATDEELRAVVDDGFDPKEYNKFMSKHVKESGSEKIKYPPPDLFLKPYIQEKDKKDITALSGQSSQA